MFKEERYSLYCPNMSEKRKQGLVGLTSAKKVLGRCGLIVS
jgi:hypothetical protein